MPWVFVGMRTKGGPWIFVGMHFCTKGGPWVSNVPVDLYSCTDKNLVIGKLTRVDLAYLIFL